MTRDKKSHHSSAEAHAEQTKSDGISVDVRFFIDSIELRHGPACGSMRTRRGFTDVELLLRYTYPGVSESEE